MEGDNELNDLVRKQIEKVIQEDELETYFPILLPILYGFVIKYETKEDVQQEDIDDLIKSLTEIGIPNTSIENMVDMVNKLYEAIPTREMKIKIDKALELAKTYLQEELADKVIDGYPYLTTIHGRSLKLIPRFVPQLAYIKDEIEIKIHLVRPYSRYETHGELVAETSPATYPSGSNIVVKNPLGDGEISGPTKEKFRQTTLETALNYLAMPPPPQIKNLETL